MSSKTRIQELIKRYDHKGLKAALAKSPQLLSVRDERRRSWLHRCAMVNPAKRGLKPADAVKVARVLIDAGIDPGDVAFREGNWHATPLWCAVGRGRNLPLVRFLLKQGVDPNHCLWAAGWHQDLPIIRALLDGGADIDPVTENETPLLAAVKAGCFEAAELLMKRGANVDWQDRQGRTALHWMLQKDRPIHRFELLIKHGARGDIPGPAGRTVIDIMSRKRDPAFRELAKKLPPA